MDLIDNYKDKCYVNARDASFGGHRFSDEVLTSLFRSIAADVDGYDSDLNDIKELITTIKNATLKIELENIDNLADFGKSIIGLLPMLEKKLKIYITNLFDNFELEMPSSITDYDIAKSPIREEYDICTTSPVSKAITTIDRSDTKILPQSVQVSQMIQSSSPMSYSVNIGSDEHVEYLKKNLISLETATKELRYMHRWELNHIDMVSKVWTGFFEGSKESVTKCLRLREHISRVLTDIPVEYRDRLSLIKSDDDTKETLTRYITTVAQIKAEEKQELEKRNRSIQTLNEIIRKLSACTNMNGTSVEMEDRERSETWSMISKVYNASEAAKNRIKKPSPPNSTKLFNNKPRLLPGSVVTRKNDRMHGERVNNRKTSVIKPNTQASVSENQESDFIVKGTGLGR